MGDVISIKSYRDGCLKLKGSTSGEMTLKAPAVASTYVINLPAANDTLVGKTTTDTLTNKRITKRVSTETSNATPSIDTDNFDGHCITALSAPITALTLSGTPTALQTFQLVIKDNGSAHAIDISGTVSASGNQALPTTTVAGVEMSLIIQRNITNSSWILKSVS